VVAEVDRRHFCATFAMHMCHKETVMALARPAGSTALARPKKRAGIADPPAAAHVEEAITTAREQGWLGGPKTRVIRARTNAALVDEPSGAPASDRIRS
jgi:hypothetical protein